MCTDGETPIQTESGLWVMAYEGEAGDWRIWPCLPVSESGIALLTSYCICVVFVALSYCWLVILPLKMTEMSKFSIVHSQYYYFLQESSEKIAVKLCRLELNAKNKDRWSREIQIMKKCVDLWRANVYVQ